MEQLDPKLLIEKSDIVGRYVVSQQQIVKGSIVLSCHSYQIAVNSDLCVDNNMCFGCGNSLDQIERCNQCKVYSFCRNCTTLSHIQSGECELLSAYQSIYDYPLPVQGVLAYRLLKNLNDQQLMSLNDLVGNIDDCDDGRIVIAKSMGIAYVSCFPGETFPEDRILDILGKIRRNGFKFGSSITLFPSSSMFNHSCGPNAVLTVEYSTDEPTTLVACVRALRDISIGEEINISYHPLGLVPTHIRREILLNKHEFECQCPYCTSHAELSDAYLLGVDSTSDTDSPEDMNPAFLNIETLIEILNEIENEMNNSLETTTDPEAVSSLLTPIIANHSSIFKYLAKLQHLNQLHYLIFQYDALMSEVYLACQKYDEIGRFTSRWLERLDAVPVLSNLCDIHLQCRMTVLHAESCYERLLSSNSLYKTEKFKERTILALHRAISISSSIYSNSYQLVVLLQNKLEEIQQLNLLQYSTNSVSFHEVYNYSGKTRKELLLHLPINPFIIRLTGFTTGIDYTSDRTLKKGNSLIDNVVEFINTYLPTGSTPCLVWDGDIYSQQSFTFLIPEINFRLSQNLQLYCFVTSKATVQSFQSSWTSSQLVSASNIHIHLLIYLDSFGWNSTNYDQYAVHNHRQQTPVRIYCFGGGDVVKFEYDQMLSNIDNSNNNDHHNDDDEQEDKYQFYDIKRINSLTGELEDSSLVGYIQPIS